jgi:NhaP-type Na+/H+ or K+/H+ antiporter
MLTNASGATEPVVSPTTYGAIVITVVLTTLATPPALKWAMARGDEKRLHLSAR